MNIINLRNEKEEVDPHLHFVESVRFALTSTPKKLSSEFFYDEKGSQLFQKITQLEEYYLTRTELAILEENAGKIKSHLQSNEIDLIELGVGDGHKTSVIIKSLLSAGIRVNYYPIDISSEAINQLKATMQESNNFQVTAIISMFFEGMDYVLEHSTNQKLVLFLGSNIGNTDVDKGESFLKDLSHHMDKGDLLLSGFDLIKDKEIMSRAYNDSFGITTEFNMNLLNRMNRELGADFDLDNFSHLGEYNSEKEAMESFLVSNIKQEVLLKELELTVSWEKSEKMQVEYSYKYSEEDIRKLAKSSGFSVCENYKDEKDYFIDSLWMKN